MEKNMEVIYKTDLYTIFSNRAKNSYLVINKLTGIIEEETNKLPTAIGSVIALEGALKKLLAKVGENDSKDSIDRH